MDTSEKETGSVETGAMVNRQRLAVLMVFTALCAPVYADRGQDAFKHGDQAERKVDYDAAAAYYKQAYTLTPGNARYFAAYMRMRFTAATQHVHAGQLLRNTGALKEAMAEFQRGVEIDGSSFIAQQELRQTAEMIRRQERQKSTPKAESPLAKLADGMTDSVELQPLSNAAISMRMTANADTAYKTICKMAGINVIIDPDYRPQKITIDLTDVTMREALDMVRLESKTFWRPVLANTIFVAADSPAKRKEIEQNVMKTFYLRNISTPAELQEAANLVRQILDVSRVTLLQAQDALILRGTPDQMVLAEKLLADIDKPKPEVVIDIAVMEVSRDKIRTIGTNVPTSATIGYLPTMGGASGTTSGSITVGNFAVGVSGGSFSFLASDSNTKLLQNPQIRAMNDQKATLRIGDRVPIATGSFAGTVGGTGVSPLVNTQFQYLDVGVNIDITPHIHSDSEVTLKMTLEISSVTGQQSIGGITQPIIGQRRIDHETRLADGEVNLIGGILEDSETQSMSGYPWLSRLPILKYLFAQDNKERTESEIIFAITPHIIRAQEVTEENLRVIDVGTGGAIELRRKPSGPAASTSAHPADAAKSEQPAPQAPPPSAPAPGASLPVAPSPAGPQTKPVAQR
jgi:general secretion pathway protein D